MIASYLRISTTCQSLDPQRSELQRYAAYKQWGPVCEYSDVISGTKSSRTGLNALTSDIKAGLIKTVMAARIDRLARSMSHYAYLISLFKSHGVALVIPSQNIDTSSSSPASKLTMDILAVIAEFERTLISERTVAALQSVRARGIRLGRPKIHSIDPLLCLSWRSQGLSNRSIASKLGVSEGTIRRIVA